MLDENSNAGGWDRYSYAVLGELKRLNSTQEEMNNTLREVLQQQAVDRQINDDFRKSVEQKHNVYDETLFQPKYGLVPRVGVIEQREEIQQAVVIDRKYIIAGAFGIVTALAIPLVGLINSILSG